jgi:hypothetical protein
MKLKMSLVALTLISVSLTALGQSVPEPEFKNSVAWLNDNSLQNLERVSPAYVSKMKGLGYGGADLLFTTEGAASNVRISQATPAFVFKASDEDTDPSLIIKLLKIDVKKGKRISKQGNVNMMGSSLASENLIPLTYKKIKPGVYLLSLQNASLVKGEYALQVPLNYQAQAATLGNSNCLWFAFGVD